MERLGYVTIQVKPLFVGLVRVTVYHHMYAVILCTVLLNALF
jgi:hypothetical protein